MIYISLVTHLYHVLSSNTTLWMFGGSECQITENSLIMARMQSFIIIFILKALYLYRLINVGFVCLIMAHCYLPNEIKCAIKMDFRIYKYSIYSSYFILLKLKKIPSFSSPACITLKKKSLIKQYSNDT